MFDQFSKNFDSTVSEFMIPIQENKYLSATLTLFLVLYAAFAAPKLPASIAVLFDNVFFRLLIFFLIVYNARKNPTIALVASVGLMISILTLNNLKIDDLMLCSAKKTEHMQNEALYAATGMAVPEAEVSVSYDEVIDLANEENTEKSDGKCTKKLNFRNNFYPQYVNMKPDAYEERYNGNDVNGFDENAKYASL